MTEIEFEIPLPFRLEIKDGYKVVSGYPDIDFCVEFHTLKKRIAYSEWFEAYETEITALRVRVALHQDRAEGGELQPLLHNAFLSALNYVNHFLDAYRITNDAVYVKSISVADMPAALVMHVGGEGCIYLTDKLAFWKPERPVSIAATMKTLGTKPSVFRLMGADRFLSSGKYYLFSEEYEKAVIDLQTSFEIFIRSAQELILQANGAAQTQIDKELEYPLKNAIEQHLAKALNTDLKLERNTVMQNWHQALYLLRNEIIHRGKYFVSEQEAEAAYRTYTEAREYLVKLMIAAGYLDAGGKSQVSHSSAGDNRAEEKIQKRLRENGFLPPGEIHKG